MWGRNVRKCESCGCFLRLKRCNLSMRVSDEEQRERKDCKGAVAQTDKRGRNL